MVDRIKEAKLLNRLQRFALAKPSDEDYESAQMTVPQVNAAKILLGKKMPDQRAIEQTIKDERIKTREEIDAGLVALGLDPKEIWQNITKH
jgi:hypothetical protein